MSSSITRNITCLPESREGDRINNLPMETIKKRIKRMSQSRFTNVALAAMAMAICGGSLQAAIVANSSTLTLYCDTVLGPTPATVGIKLSAAGSAVNVTVTAPTLPVVLSSTSPASVGSISTYTNFTFTLAPGCKGAVNAGTQTLTFTPAGGTAITVAATFSVTTSSGSALAPSPSAVNITCNLTTGTYVPGPSVAVKVTSPAYNGTPFTVDNTVNVLPSWLSVTSLAGGTATATPVSLTVVAATGCGGLGVGTTNFVVHLLNAPAADKLLPVTIQVGGTTPLTPASSSVSLSYTTGTTPSSSVTDAISATAAFFTVNPATLPVWLNVTPTFGSPVTSTPTTLTFAVTAGAKTLTPGAYSGAVHLQVSGALDTVITVSLEVTNPGASLTISDATYVSAIAYTKSINWTLGTTLPSLQITPVSSDAPIAFAVTTTAGTLSPQVSETSGLAYSFGSPITVTFLQSIFGAATPGSALSGTVTITPQGGTGIVVTLTVNVKSPGPVITSLFPASLPTATSGSFAVALSGTGFVVSGSPTVVGIVSGGLMVTDSNVVGVVSNSTTIQLTITVPTNPDPYLPFGAGGTVTLGVCNPLVSTCSTPNSTMTFVIGINPVIQAVVSAASFTQATAPALTPVAPYDILSIFGTDFCISGGTGCTSANLYGTLNTTTLGYLSALSPDPAGATQRNVTVTFQTHGRTPAPIANAPLLFANNNQINLIVPDEVKPYIGQTVDIVVNFGYGTTINLLSSSPYSVTITATDPGVFSTSGDGQGQAAALSLSYALVGNTSSNTAGLRNNGTDSDIIQLYVAGLGKPDSDGTSQGYPTPLTCQTVEGYWAAVNLATSSTLTSNDGLVIQTALVPTGDLPPCLKFLSADQPSVTIGGVPATVDYAGWVFGTVAVLYQINVQLPLSTATGYTDASGTTGAVTHVAQNMPVVVTANGMSSQTSGLNLWVQQKLLMTVTGALTGGHTPTAWPGTTITATDGAPSPTITYALTSANLPGGLTFSTSTGVIGGTASSSGTTVLVITATDSVSGCTGVVTVTLVIS